MLARLAWFAFCPRLRLSPRIGISMAVSGVSTSAAVAACVAPGIASSKGWHAQSECSHCNQSVKMMTFHARPH